MATSELQIEPKCPDCGRLTVDNNFHCPEKSHSQWAKSCRWMKCVGKATPTETLDPTKLRRCNRVYGPIGWPGFKGG